MRSESFVLREAGHASLVRVMSVYEAVGTPGGDARQGLPGSSLKGERAREVCDTQFV